LIEEDGPKNVSLFFLGKKEKERRGSVITSNESLQECASGSSPIGSIQCRLQEEAIA